MDKSMKIGFGTGFRFWFHIFLLKKEEKRDIMNVYV